MKGSKKIVKILTVIITIAVFGFSSFLFTKDLNKIKQDTKKLNKQRILYGRDGIGVPKYKVDPARVGVIKIRFNIATAQYLVSIASIALVSTTLMLLTRRKP